MAGVGGDFSGIGDAPVARAAEPSRVQGRGDFSVVLQDYNLGKMTPQSAFVALTDEKGSLQRFTEWATGEEKTFSLNVLIATLEGLKKQLQDNPEVAKKLQECINQVREALTVPNLSKDVLQYLARHHLPVLDAKALGSITKKLHALSPDLQVRSPEQASQMLQRLLYTHTPTHFLTTGDETRLIAEAFHDIFGTKQQSEVASRLQLFQAWVNAIPVDWEIHFPVSPSLPEEILKLLYARFGEKLHLSVTWTIGSGPISEMMKPIIPCCPSAKFSLTCRGDPVAMPPHDDAMIADLVAMIADLNKTLAGTPNVVGLNLETVSWPPEVFDRLDLPQSLQTLSCSYTNHESPLTDQNFSKLSGCTQLESLTLLGNIQVTGRTFSLLPLNLKKLHCVAINIGNNEVSTIISRFKQLQELSVCSPFVTGFGFDQLPESLVKLVCEMSPVTDDAIRSLARLNNLQELNVNHIQISTPTYATLPTSLRVLECSHSGLQDTAFVHLSRLSNLEVLNISDNPEVQGNNWALLTLPTSLIELNCGRCPLSNDALAPLKNLEHLKRLDLSGNSIMTGDAFFLLPRTIERLDCRVCNKLQDSDLANLGHLQHLKVLNIMYNDQIKGDFVDRLPPSLKELHCNTDLSEQAKDTLRRNKIEIIEEY